MSRCASPLPFSCAILHQIVCVVVFLQLTDDRVRTAYEQNLQAATESAKQYARELESVRIQLAMAEAYKKDNDVLTSLNKQHADTIAQLQEDVGVTC